MIYINDNIDAFDVEAALPLLSDERREQTLRFRFERGRKTCAAAYLLLCEALRKEYGITEKPIFEYGIHGKPFIIGYPDIHFNISHCREAVESIRSYKDSLVNYTMNPQEIAKINQAPRPEVEFVRFWTMKEAVLKLSGEGISKDLKTVLTGQEQIETQVNMEKNYIYSIIYG